MNQSALVKISDFLSLGNGWCYGEGLRFLRSTTDKANQIVIYFLSSGFSTIDAFPGLNGEIRVTAYAANHYLEFTLDSSGLSTFVHEKNDQEIAYEENLGLRDCYEKIMSLSNLCNLYESSIKGITTRTVAGFKALLLDRHQTEVFPLFATGVPLTLRERYASTFTVTTPTSAEARQFFGYSTPQFCHARM